MLGQAIFSRAIFSQAIAARSQDWLGRFLLDKFLPPLPFVARPGHDAIERSPDGARDDALLGRLGSLEVRLASSPAEIRRAQRLRYRIFFEDGPATATFTARLLRRDADRFDPVCEHLLVIDHAARDAHGPAVVGTYRLQRQEIAAAHRGFYSAGEFGIDDLVARHRHLKFLELGRSCVLAPYRNKRTVELLWHGIWSYVRRQDLDVMIGCASLDGTDPRGLSLPLSFLHHFAKAPEDWQVSALASRRVDMNRMPKSAIDPRAALRALPPLIKGYLRLGAFCGDGAVIDHSFGTTDVLIVLPVSAISARYIGHFGTDADRHAA
jgi:putative hemolysin